MSRIQQLSKDTIQRIAAGEVVQQPSSALKELLENSIDASSTQISIELKEGGMSLLQISDNGSGINVSDFPILCHRFTTSKISQFEDLSSLTTFGFRGEALSSISLVSKVTVISRKAGEPIAYKADFIDNELAGSPAPIAFNQGTKIIVKDLFYNNLGRKRGLSNHSQLLKSCYEVVQKYALHYSNIAFSFKSENSGFSTDGKGDKNKIIGELVKGVRYEEDLMQVQVNENEFCRFYGIVTGWKFAWNLKELVLFINGRLVESPQLKNLLAQVYSKYLFKHVAFFVYLAIEIAPAMLDVNVHPCKLYVRFMKEPEIFSEISKSVTALLDQDINSNRSTLKTFEPGGKILNLASNEEKAGGLNLMTSNEVANKIYPKSQVRCKPQVPLEWFIESKPVSVPKARQEELTSISDLRSEILPCEAQDLLDNFFYVGSVNKDFVLLQYKNELFLCSTQAILTCCVYQNVLDNFGTFPCFDIQESTLEIRRLVELALNDPSLYDPASDPPREQVVEKVSDLIESKKEMLDEYFSIEIRDHVLTAIPVLLDSLVQPDINKLPEFLLRIGLEVDWKREKDCLGKICELVAWFYGNLPDEWKINENVFDYKYHYKNTIFPYLRGRVKADPRFISFSNGIIRIVSTAQLYTIFERC